MSRSTGTVAPSNVTTPRGSTGGWGFVPIPNASETDACATSSTPSDAASFASGEPVRRGRKARYSITKPSTIRTTSVITSAAHVGASQP